MSYQHMTYHYRFNLTALEKTNKSIHLPTINPPALTVCEFIVPTSGIVAYLLFFWPACLITPQQK